MTGGFEYSKNYVVHVYETGPNGILAIHSLFNFLQDIASEHATRLRFGKDDLLKENRFWVLSRIYANITIWPGWEESLTVKTWPRGTDKLFALRDYQVTRRDGKIIASATSSWLVVDLMTRRVQRPDSLLSYINSEMPSSQATGRNAGKLNPTGENPVADHPLRVRQSDLDINLHVNNVNYIKWVSDHYSTGFINDHMPSEIEVNFLAEARIDEELILKTMRDAENVMVFNHSLFRISDDVEICRARIAWSAYKQ